MLKVNYETLGEKTNNYQSLAIKDKYVLADKIYKMIKIADTEKLDSTLTKSGIKGIFSRAEDLVYSKVTKGMIIVPEPQKREITLVFSNNETDTTGPFFEVEKLAGKLGKDNIEKLIILGFFMNEENMNVIQSYNLLSSEISMVINE